MAKIRKIIPYGRTWETEANALARSYVAEVFPCAKCSHPVITGYCCQTCGDTNPTQPAKGEKENGR